MPGQSPTASSSSASAVNVRQLGFVSSLEASANPISSTSILLSATGTDLLVEDHLAIHADPNAGDNASTSTWPFNVSKLRLE
jgi:hypothetical protein